jgi:hypothetical protein
MNVKYAARKLLHKPRREQPHVSRKAHEINPVLLERGDDFTIMLSPVLILRRNHKRGEAQPTGSVNTSRILPIGNNNSDARIRNTPGRDIVCNGLEVRTASGEQDAEILHWVVESLHISIRPAAIIIQLARRLAGLLPSRVVRYSFKGMYKDFHALDRWTKRDVHCIYQALIVAIATRHADAVDIKFLVDGRPVWIALPHPAWVEYQKRTGKLITDPLAVEIAGHYLKYMLESGEGVDREMYSLTVAQTLEHLEAAVEEKVGSQPVG